MHVGCAEDSEWIWSQTLKFHGISGLSGEIWAKVARKRCGRMPPSKEKPARAERRRE